MLTSVISVTLQCNTSYRCFGLFIILEGVWPAKMKIQAPHLVGLKVFGTVEVIGLYGYALRNISIKHTGENALGFVNKSEFRLNLFLQHNEAHTVDAYLRKGATIQTVFFMFDFEHALFWFIVQLSKPPLTFSCII